MSERDVVRFGPEMLARLREELGDDGGRPDVSRYGVQILKAQCPVCGRWVRSLWVHVERHAREARP